MIRPLEEKDRAVYLSMSRAFYESDAVLSPVPEENREKTFDLLMQGTPFAEGFLFEKNGAVAGYALLARTWSQEAGGEVIWLEEIYLLPQMRSLGIGSKFYAFLRSRYPKAKRFRLEVEDENEGAVRLYKKWGFSFFPYKQMKKDF